MGSLLLVLGLLLAVASGNRLMTENLDRVRSSADDGGVCEYTAVPEAHIFKGAYVGMQPDGLVKPFVPGDRFVGIANEECDNRTGAPGNPFAKAYVRTLGDYQVPSAQLVESLNFMTEVFAVADDTLAISGHPDAFIGMLIVKADGSQYVRLRRPGEKPTGPGSVEIFASGIEAFEATGVAASATKYHPAGLIMENALGLGVLQVAGSGGGIKLALDTTAEIALASVYSQDSFPVAGGITFEADVCMTNKGDNAAVDFDFGMGTLLTANSKADIDHADMVNLFGFHMDGNSDNILVQSDDDTTDVAPVDTGEDNDSAADVPKHLLGIIRPDGSCEAWIGTSTGITRQLDAGIPASGFAVDPTAALAFLLNLEKTNDDSSAEVIVKNLRIAGARA